MTSDQRATSNAEEGAPVVLGSEVVYDGFVKVRVDRVRLPSGTEARREVVEHPGAVGVLALSADGHVLLVRQWRQAVGRFLLEIPAGTREPGEPPEETARRELVEEIGYEPAELSPLTTLYPSPGYSAERIALFRADGCRQVEHTPDLDEGVSLVRVPVGDVPALLADPTRPVEDSKSLVALLWLLRGRNA